MKYEFMEQQLTKRLRFTHISIVGDVFSLNARSRLCLWYDPYEVSWVVVTAILPDSFGGFIFFLPDNCSWTSTARCGRLLPIFRLMALPGSRMKSSFT
jgi:hypothetical protein